MLRSVFRTRLTRGQLGLFTVRGLAHSLGVWAWFFAMARIAAVVVALIGALIILRPGFRDIGLGHYAMLIAALVFGASYLLGKLLTDRASSAVVVVMLSVVVPVGLGPLAISVWVTPDDS